jgi:prevent-host-death family protein
MSSVTVRELRDKGGEVLERVERGERVIVTRDGRPGAELRPLPRASARPAELIGRRKQLPPVDPDAALRECERSVRPVPSHRLAGGTPERDALAAAV